MTKNLFVLVFAFFFIGCSEASLGFKAIDQDTCVESCDEGTLLSEEPILYPTAFEIKESQAQDVACARVLDSANKVLNSNVYCDAKHVGKVCNYAFNLERSVCNKADKIWYQKAIDEASDLYQNDPTSHPKVKLSAGTIKLEYLLPAHWPYGDYIGIHLKEGVSLEGTSYESFQTNIRLSKNILKDVDSEQPLIQDRVLRAMILVAKNRIYQSPKETVLSETQNNQIYDLTLSGHFGGDINCRSLAEQEIGVESGILAAGVNQIAIRNVQAYHFSGNILEMGLYLPWVKEDHLCNGISCLGKRMWVKGSSSNPAIISKNHLCDGKFGGIVLVGQEAKISDNTIQYIHQ
ncbi:MAG: hypothetical protein KDD50_05140, partial [Bdellovibrionales bacterium]|nr:hypothetical protein [Bdellovibrionales bacterium]